MKLFFIALFSLLAQFVYGETAKELFSTIPKKLKPTIEHLEKLPEVRQLMQGISREGKIRLEAARDLPFGALWEGERRRIVVNVSPDRNSGDILASLLFEMHNAAADKKFQKLDKLASEGKITRNAYIESVERIEHANAINSTGLVMKGIRLGFFPSSAERHVPENFQEYFRIQKKHGHSQCIGEMYDQIRNFCH